MVKVKLKGGLGNQMFQYAAGKLLASALERELKLDLGFLMSHKKGISKREYQLDLYDIQSEIIDDAGKESLLKKLFFKLQYPLLKRLRHTLVLREINERELEKYRVFKNIVLDGYFFDLRPLQTQKKQIEHIFRFRKEWAYMVNELLRDVQSSESVCVHIRRGDYLTEKNQQIYHSCDIAFYKQAMKQMRANINAPVFFVFSDDLKWAEEALRDEVSVRYVDVRHAKKDELEFFLMAHCKHNIIANSTYSWWAGYLNENRQKRIIAPKIWYKEKGRNDAALRLIPSDWKLL